jgi:hypothetical protein
MPALYDRVADQAHYVLGRTGSTPRATSSSAPTTTAATLGTPPP